MRKLDSTQVQVELSSLLTNHFPPLPRRYTLIGSEKIAPTRIYIGRRFSSEQLIRSRDEILAEWRRGDDEYILCLQIFIGGSFSYSIAQKRYNFFLHEIPIALKIISHSDLEYLTSYPELTYLPTVISFESVYNDFNLIIHHQPLRDFF